MRFEPGWGMLRYVCLGEVEVLRGVYAAVRDENWGTVPPRLSELAAEVNDDSFRLRFDVVCRRGDIDFTWRGEVAGTSDGTVSYRFDGRAESSFLHNRIGFCVLHPVATCAGQAVTIEHSDGRSETGAFPLRIAPHQPWMDIRAVRYSAGPATAEVRFAGDVFEMEDQRNWSDASFKTYCTPLAHPLPVRLEAGAEVHQEVTLRLEGAPAVAEPTEPPAEVRLSGGGPLPKLGLCVASHGRDLAEPEVERLRALNLSHLRVDVDFSDGGWAEALEQADRQASAIGAGLEAGLLLGEAPETELDALRDRLQRCRSGPLRLLVLSAGTAATPPGLVALARQRLGGAGGEAEFAAGTYGNFTELNRNRGPVGQAGTLCYSVTPQVHAFDDTSLIETLPTQAEQVRSLREFAGDARVAVTPVTLRPRSRRHEPGPGELPPEVDPRQMSLLCAGWTLGGIKHLSAVGADSATYFETTGWRGVMETADGSRMPDAFPSIAGGVYPVWHVLAWLGEFAGAAAVPTRSSRPLEFEALAVRRGGRQRVLVANLSPRAQEIALPDLSAPAEVRYLDETTAGRAMREPETFRRQPPRRMEGGKGLRVELGPWAVACIDTEVPGR
jgi:hypothetical protein